MTDADLLFLVAVAGVAVVGGATAAIAGFGIGSLLTPLLALALDMSLAVAVVSVPHAVATGLRWWRLRHFVDTRLLRWFGLLSAIGGLAGALVHARAGSRSLTLLLGALLLLTAISVTGDPGLRWTPGRVGSAVLGALSGFFGGAAGNQGGLRAAALLMFTLTPTAFVATSTATGLIVDAARLPVYLWTSGSRMVAAMPMLVVATVGVVIGTLAGERLLLGLTREQFRRAIGVLVGLLGVWLLVREIW